MCQQRCQLINLPSKPPFSAIKSPETVVKERKDAIKMILRSLGVDPNEIISNEAPRWSQSPEQGEKAKEYLERVVMAAIEVIKKK